MGGQHHARDCVAKIVVYITRGPELLVFTQPAFPEAGLQVLAGTVKAGEQLEAAVMREALEETGLTGLLLRRRLGETEFDMAEFGRDEIHHRHFCHLELEAEAAAPATWSHAETSGGEADSIEFGFRWHDLRSGPPPLIAEQGALLQALGYAL